VPDLLQEIEAFYDAVPRPRADAHEQGPFTLFVARTGWPYYARPSLGATQVTESDVRAVVDLANRMHVPVSLEWVHETTPALADAAQAAGMRVHRMPLLMLEGPVAAVAGSGVDVQLLEADDPRFGDVRAAVHAGFNDSDDKEPEPVATHILDHVRAGLMRVAGAFTEDGSAVGGGSSQTRGHLCELTGIATLPAWRRHGIGASLTRLLAEDAMTAGAATVFLSAGDDAVARVYERVGFRRVATACIGEPS
jgi:predicted GNAT family acetyltransferase